MVKLFIIINKIKIGLFLLIPFFLLCCGSPTVKKNKKLKKIIVTDTAGTIRNFSDTNNYVYQFTWMDYNKTLYTDTFVVSKEETKKAASERLKIQAMSLTCPQPDYTIISNKKSVFISNLAKKLKRKAKLYNLDIGGTVNMVVAMVQNIPYTLIHNMSHNAVEDQEQKQGGNFCKQYHQDTKHKPFDRIGGCIENVEPCGVYSPAEFIASLCGDCDTRTVFIYTLLREMGLISIVVNGPGHSMLATPYLPENPAAVFLTFKGIKYYFWETTIFYNFPQGTGPRNGDTPPNFNAAWTVVLN